MTTNTTSLQRYLGEKYDINGNIYELIDVDTIDKVLSFQSVNNDDYLFEDATTFNLDNYLR